MERKIDRMTPLKSIAIPQMKNVAAYVRVSSEKESMMHSLSAQVSYFSEYIQRHGDWLYAGVYADEAKTGTQDTRPEFQRLLADCRAGKIQIVLTKSISRFARNTMTLLATVRELTDLGIAVYFERENIWSNTGEGELMLSLLAAYAEEESLSVSENCKWRIRKGFEKGEPYGLHAMLGYRYKKGEFTIVPEEAEIVRRIFNDYLSGDGIIAIVKKLRAEGIRISRNAVGDILRNVTYQGDLLLQRTYIKDHLSKKQLVNRGELPFYHVENDHEGIISRSVFAAVKEEIASRREIYQHKEGDKGNYPLTGLIHCGKCGCVYKRKITPYRVVWVCPTFNTVGKEYCASQQVPESVLNMLIDERGGLSGISEIIVPEANCLQFRFKDGREELAEWHTSRRDSWTPEMKEAARQRRYEQESAKKRGAR
jgi:DNA invertase Pin-like site-specific DNA recombinase